MCFLSLFYEARPAILKSDINNILLHLHLTSTLLVSCLPFDVDTVFHTSGGILSLSLS